MKKLAMVLGMALALAAQACGGGGCEGACEDSKGCDGSVVPEDYDCGAACDALADAAADAGCSAEYDDYVSCASGQDVCEPDASACSDEATAYGECFAGI